MTPTLIYVWGIADNVRGCLSALLAVAAFAAAGSIMAHVACKSEDLENGARLAMVTFKRSITIGLPILVAWASVPSSKTIAAMVIIPTIANSEVIKRDIPDIYEAAISKLKEELTTK